MNHSDGRAQLRAEAFQTVRDADGPEPLVPVEPEQLPEGDYRTADKQTVLDTLARDYNFVPLDAR